MTFIPHTPESLIQRSDSKNPAATCGGLTAGGRPCRRAVAPILPSVRQDSARLFCWQHKDQAEHTVQVRLQGMQMLRGRTSTDTLVDRLGLLNVDSGRRQRKSGREGRLEKTEHDQYALRRPRPKPKRKSTFLCCFEVVDDQPIAPRPVQKQHAMSLTSRSQRAAVPESGRVGARAASSRPAIPRDPSSSTMALLSLIPKDVSPQTASSLLAELAKPVSGFDEAGYIYMFWLTAENLPPTPAEAALNLLESPKARPNPGHRRASDVLRSFSDSSSTKKILLKIGRASNVQRRLNEWNRQCGYNLSLIRYYPYHPTSTGSEMTPRKVAHAHKVERLIHLELAGKKAQDNGPCSQCGREHREWFKIEAHKAGVRSVDEVIRRWVDWGLSQTTKPS